MGAMGFVGKHMVIDCNIEVGYCRTSGMQMSVHAFYLSSRRAVARIFPDGRVGTAPIRTGSPCQRRRRSNGTFQQAAKSPEHDA